MPCLSNPISLVSGANTATPPVIVPDDTTRPSARSSFVLRKLNENCPAFIGLLVSGSYEPLLLLLGLINDVLSRYLPHRLLVPMRKSLSFAPEPER